VSGPGVDASNVEQHAQWGGDLGLLWAARAEQFEASAAGYDAPLLEAADLGLLEGPDDLYGEGYLLGADFDEDGALWYFYYPYASGPADAYPLYLGSIPAPFSLDAAAADSGVVNTGTAGSTGIFPGLTGPQPLLAVEGSTSQTLPDTGVEVIAPIGAAAIALLGGLLLLLGRRRDSAAA